MEEKPYPTDKFGRPDGRNYHYRIPLNGKHKRALSKVRIAESIKDRWIVIETSCKRDGIIGYRHIQTKDNKGPISGLGEYEYSAQWEYPFGPGRKGQLRARSNTAGGGGSKIEGTIPAYDEAGFEYRLEVSFVSELTMSQLRDMDGNAYNILARELGYAEQEAHEARQEAIAEAQRECDHTHTVMFDEPKAGKYGRSEGFCEDCGKDLLAE